MGDQLDDERAIDSADRVRVLSDAAVLDAFRAAFGSQGAEDALRRADDPERSDGDGTPSPFAGLETARRRLFAPDSSDEDRARWRSLEDGRAAERIRVDAVLSEVLRWTTSGAPAVDSPPGPSAVRRSRIGALVGAGGLLAVVLIAIVVVAGPGTASRSSPTASFTDRIEPPPLDGTTLLTLVDRLEPGVTATSTVNWNSGYDPLQPGGSGLRIALRCRGTGRVVVRLTDESFPFTCDERVQTFVRTSPGPHPDAIVVFVPTTGRVLWGLRIAELAPTGTDVSVP